MDKQTNLTLLWCNSSINERGETKTDIGLLMIYCFDFCFGTISMVKGEDKIKIYKEIQKCMNLFRMVQFMAKVNMSLFTPLAWVN